MGKLFSGVVFVWASSHSSAYADFPNKLSLVMVKHQKVKPLRKHASNRMMLPKSIVQ
jgi:hypothetical protein